MTFAPSPKHIKDIQPISLEEIEKKAQKLFEQVTNGDSYETTHSLITTATDRRWENTIIPSHSYDNNREIDRLLENLPRLDSLDETDLANLNSFLENYRQYPIIKNL